MQTVIAHEGLLKLGLRPIDVVEKNYHVIGIFVKTGCEPPQRSKVADPTEEFSTPANVAAKNTYSIWLSRAGRPPIAPTIASDLLIVVADPGPRMLGVHSGRLNVINGVRKLDRLLTDRGMLKQRDASQHAIELISKAILR